MTEEPPWGSYIIKYVRKVCMYSLAPFNDWSIHVVYKNGKDTIVARLQTVKGRDFHCVHDRTTRELVSIGQI